MNEQQPAPSSTERERHRYQFTRRSILLGVVLFALCIGLITMCIFVVRQRSFYILSRQTRDKIESLTARCPAGVPPKQWQNALSWTANLIGQEYSSPVDSDPDSLKQLYQALDDRIKGPVDLTTLQWVWDQCEKAPRAGAEYAIKFRSVRLLTKEPITDSDLPHMWSLHKCARLDLSNTQVTDVGLRHLADASNLIGLSLDNTQVTDVGLRHLAGLTNLVVLSLANTQVTDAGLRNLEGLTKLELISLNNTKVTVEGTKKLQNALPQCQQSADHVIVDWEF